MSSHPQTPAALLIGADVGGTRTRVAVSDRAGNVLAVDEQPGGNPNAVGVATSAERIRTAITNALRQAQGPHRTPKDPEPRPKDPEPRPKGPELVEGPGIGAIVLGMAGFGTAQDAGQDFIRAAIPKPFDITPRIVSDLGVAYASATSVSRGTVLIAGTGSAAADIDDGEIVTRRGGWGWLLGDEGAGFWLGREAVRQALTELERGVGPGAMTRQVIDALGIDRSDPFGGLLRVPYLENPVRLAELAPIVTGLVDSDPAAASICARAAGALTDLTLDLGPRPGRPIVVAGSVLQAADPIRSAFAERIRVGLSSPVLDARSGLVGALWLAAGTGPDGCPAGTEQDPDVHRQLLATAG